MPDALYDFNNIPGIHRFQRIVNSGFDIRHGMRMESYRYRKECGFDGDIMRQS